MGLVAFPALEPYDRLRRMKLTTQVKLLPTPEQAQLLQQTLEAANAACKAISEVAWTTKEFNQYKLHQALYLAIRQDFGLSAQLAVRCLGKVAASNKTDQQRRHRFQPAGAIPYDSRILAYRQPSGTVSIWTRAGRQEMAYVCGERQQELLKHQKGESDLWLHNGEFYLLASCEVAEQTAPDVASYLGVDGGIVNLATDSDGEVHRANHVNHVRYRHRRLRRKLQKKGTKSARRLLRRLAGKERRFAKDTNHCISKQLVTKAQGTKRGIALEDLQGIRDRLTVSKSQRVTLHSWSFDDLQHKIKYKARLYGVKVVWVDPRNTSRTCPECACIDKRNRPSQALFKCVACGFSGHADHIAAVNISRRASVNKPYASDATARP